MSVFFSSAMTAACRHLPEEMVHTSFKKAAATLNKVFRDHCASFYLEWHLAEPSRTDILASLPYDSLNNFLGGIVSTASQPSGKHSHEFFSPVVPILSSWGVMQKKLGGGLPHIWLACDFQSVTGKFSSPNIHFCVDRNFHNRTRERSYINNIPNTTFRKIADMVVDAPWPEKKKWSGNFLKKTYHTLRTLNGEIIHLSFMHTRVPSIAKLNMTIPSEQVAELLDTLGWSAYRNKITDYCTIFAADEPRLKGNICLSDNRLIRFELELEYNFPLHYDKRREVMLRELKKTGLASAAQTAVMRRWPGREDIAYRNRIFTFERWLDCKISFTPDGKITAKPYFGFAPLPKIGWNRDVLYE